MKKTCPTCKFKINLEENNSFLPFCSERCKLIDLSNWGNEIYKIFSKKQNRNNK